MRGVEEEAMVRREMEEEETRVIESAGVQVKEEEARYGKFSNSTFGSNAPLWPNGNVSLKDYERLDYKRQRGGTQNPAL